MNDKKELSIKALVVYFVFTFVGALGLGAFGMLSFINTAPFRISAMEMEIKEIKSDIKEQQSLYMPLDLSTEKWKNNEAQHVEIVKKLDNILLMIQKI